MLGVLRGAHARTRCRTNLEITLTRSYNIMSHVDKMEAHEIRQMSEAGMSKKDIAYATQRSRPTIDRILGMSEREVDKQADRHDRFLGEMSSGCYDGDEEMMLFDDPTADYAERVEFCENNINLKVFDT